MTNRKRQNLLTVALVIILAGIAGYYFYSTNHAGKAYVEVKTFKGAGGWGYDIMVEKKPYIHQDFIPAITGKKAFETEEDARKTGDRVLEKIRNNEIPALTVKDLKELGIIKDTVSQVHR